MGQKSITTHKELREYVNEKFGSMRIFAESTGQDHGVVNAFLYRSDDNVTEEEKKRIQAMYSLAFNCEPMIDKTKLTDDEKAAIKICMFKAYSNVKEAANDVEELTYFSAREISVQNVSRKTKGVRALVRRLKTKLGEKEQQLNKFELAALETVKGIK